MKRFQIGREDGIALIMALGIMFVLSIALVSIIAYTTANLGHSSRSRTGQQAYAVAEAALNDSFAQVASHYPTAGAATLYDASWLPSSEPSTGVSYAGGDAKWWGTFVPDNSKSPPEAGYWTITAKGTAPNPTAPGQTVTRTITAKIDVTPLGGLGPPPDVWNYVYSGAGPTLGCDMTISQTVDWVAPLWVKGNLCLQNQAKIKMQSGTTGDRLVVGGFLKQESPQTTVGTSALKMSGIRLVGACIANGISWGPSPSCPNGDAAATKVYYTTIGGTMPNPILVPETVAWATKHADTSPGPKHPCVAASSSAASTWPKFDDAAAAYNAAPGSLASVNLTPGTSYTCVAADGMGLQWTAATKTLTLISPDPSLGTQVYIDGNVSIDTGNGAAARYVGFGDIYVRGKLNFQNNTKLCAVVLGSSCNETLWDGSQAMLRFFASGGPPNSVEVVSASFQGGLFGVNDISLSSGGNVQGPMISLAAVSPGQAGGATFPVNMKVIRGGPGGSAKTYLLGAARDISY